MEEKKASVDKLATIAIVAIVVGFAGWYGFGRTALAKHRGQQAAANELINPSSAQFRNVRLGALDSVCGEINGKNRLGAYVGFRSFYADAKGATASIEPDDRNDDEGEAAPVLRSTYYTIYHSNCG